VTIILGGDSLFHNRKTPTSNPRYGGSVAAMSSSREGATPPKIQFLSTIQPTSQLHLILIQLLFSNQSQGISLKSHTLTHFHVHIHSYNFVVKTITQQQFHEKIKNCLILIDLA
jgi:hypothetical protein